MKFNLLGACAALSMTLVASVSAQASITAVGSRAALGATDSIDWGQVGDAFTQVHAPASVTSLSGRLATVTSAGGVLLREDQGNGGWIGDFAYGEHLLWTEGFGPDITITFAHAVKGVGAQIQADFSGAYTAEIIGMGGKVLGTYSQSGSSGDRGDGSAVFVGLLSDTADITSIAFHLTDARWATNDFAIGTLSIVGVPEPATWGLMICGFLGAGLALRRRRLAAA